VLRAQLPVDESIEVGARIRTEAMPWLHASTIPARAYETLTDG
jgi:hypothetical protein